MSIYVLQEIVNSFNWAGFWKEDIVVVVVVVAAAAAIIIIIMTCI
jgi:hypothetical protein